VELIIVISILILLAIVTVSISNDRKDKSDNSKVVADIATINTAISANNQEQTEIVLPQ
jgi:type II secretory pathway pseudopilin PulG